MKSFGKQPWIRSANFDLAWFIGPAWISSLIVLLLSPYWGAQLRGVPTWAWVALVLCVDVAHVYSTLYRTYFDPEESARYRELLWVIPLLCWLCGVGIYSIGGAALFWTVLAYLAVFHFVRQQYGFVRVYSRTERESEWSRAIDAVAIYMATLYPLIYWHTHLPRDFHWFVEGDFVVGIPPETLAAARLIFLFSFAAFLLKEARTAISKQTLNIPRLLFTVGTAIAWYVGIVHFNSDMPFTFTNVVSHGVPYIALVWAFGQRKYAARASTAGTPLALKFYQNFPLFIGLLILLAYLEEGLWDGLVWREHLSVFGAFSGLPVIKSKEAAALLVPILTVPQATHYVLDAFVWRLKKPSEDLQMLLYAQEAK